MEPEIAPVAEVDAPPVPTTAVDHAVTSGDVSAFREAKAAERAGKPLSAPVAKTEERTVSKRQQQINDYERTVAELKAENARLKTPTPTTLPVPAPRAELTPVDDPEPNPLDATKYPDGQYDPKFIRDLSAHAARTERAKWDAEQQDLRSRESLTRTQEQRASKFNERIRAHEKDDPEFFKTLSDDVKALKPFAALKPGEKGGMLNAVAEEIMSSPIAPQLLRHLSDHPDELARFAAFESARDLIFAMGKLEGDLERKSAPPPPPKPVTSMTRPPTTLGSKATEPVSELDAAVATGDVARFREARAKERAAQFAR